MLFTKQEIATRTLRVKKVRVGEAQLFAEEHNEEYRTIIFIPPYLVVDRLSDQVLYRMNISSELVKQAADKYHITYENRRFSSRNENDIYNFLVELSKINNQVLPEVPEHTYVEESLNSAVHDKLSRKTRECNNLQLQ